jgi:L-asparaginase / beta-aspartyl-peptidase
MKAIILLLGVILGTAGCSNDRHLEGPLSGQETMKNGGHIGLVVHGGAGVIRQGSLSAEREAAYRATLTEAYMAGYGVLEKGGKSMEAVEAVIRVLEDSPMFNAGKGAVFNADGKNEMDASVMDGKTLAAGAVAGVHHVKNPIVLARKVMEKSPHVMLAGDGAEVFAKQEGVELVEAQYFWTQARWDELQRAKEAERKKAETQPIGRDPSANMSSGAPTPQDMPPDRNDMPPGSHYGTVGCVALDKEGNIAAGTSTGGMTNKKWGRVGDSPIIGAGTYADNRTCGVSATGWGEYFIRVGVARDMAAMMEYKGMSVQAAADAVIKKVGALGGDGGVIALDKAGHVGIAFNTEGMYRAYMGKDGKVVVEIYGK